MSVSDKKRYLHTNTLYLLASVTRDNGSTSGLVEYLTDEDEQLHIVIKSTDSSTLKCRP